MKKLFFALIALTLCIPQVSFAANTYSIDLERGSSQYLSRADSALFTSDDWTIESNIQPETLPTSGSSNMIAGKLLGGSGDAAEFHLRLRNSAGTNQVLCAWQDGINPAFEVIYTTTTPTDHFTHYRCTRVRSTGRMIIYAFGVDVANSVQNTGAAPNTDRSVGLGYADYGGAFEFFDGLQDETRFWSTASPTLAWNECATGATANLVAAWSLDNVLTDLSGNSLTLTNNNGAVFSTTIPTYLACGAGGGGGGGTKWFNGNGGPVFDFFLTTYYNPIVIIASSLLVLAFFIAIWKIYQAFRDWHRRNDMGFR